MQPLEQGESGHITPSSYASSSPDEGCAASGMSSGACVPLRVGSAVVRFGDQLCRGLRSHKALQVVRPHIDGSLEQKTKLRR